MTNLDCIFKSRDITLPTKVRLVKAMVFPVVMYGCESWTVKKAEHRIDAFALGCIKFESLRVNPLMKSGRNSGQAKGDNREPCLYLKVKEWEVSCEKVKPFDLVVNEVCTI